MQESKAQYNLLLLYVQSAPAAEPPCSAFERVAERVRILPELPTQPIKHCRSIKLVVGHR